MNNLRTLPWVPAKTFPPIFFMVHLLHRLYGVDAPAHSSSSDFKVEQKCKSCTSRFLSYTIISSIGKFSRGLKRPPLISPTKNFSPRNIAYNMYRKFNHSCQWPVISQSNHSNFTKISPFWKRKIKNFAGQRSWDPPQTSPWLCREHPVPTPHPIDVSISAHTVPRLYTPFAENFWLVSDCVSVLVWGDKIKWYETACDKLHLRSLFFSKIYYPKQS